MSIIMSQFNESWFDIPVSQWTPVYPARHVHVKPFTASTQPPPFSHGLLEHSSKSEGKMIVMFQVIFHGNLQ